MPLNIAVDGPAGAGKSSIAKAVAKRLNILYLDTGAMYRAVGLACLRGNVSLEDEAAVTAKCADVKISVRHGENGQVTLLDGENVSEEIRRPEMSMAASKVATYGGVRRMMVALQQKLAQETDMIMDGRDIGTRVLPDATVKVFLTATAEERAMRRFRDLQEKNLPDTYEQVLADLIRRDDQDMNREVDPLRQAEDALLVDSTHLDFDGVVEAILKIVEEKRA